MILPRRTALLGTSALTLAALAGCGTAVTPAEVLSALETVPTALFNAFQQVAPGALSASTVTTVNGDLADAKNVAAAISGALPATTGASTAQTIEGYINAAFSVLAAPPVNGLIPAPFNVAVAAADLVLTEVIEPFISSVVGVTASAPLAAGSVRASARASVSGMTLAQAQATLAAFAGAKG